MTENKETFFARLKPRLPPSEITAVRGAYYLAKHCHRSQVRKEIDENGNPKRYFEHIRRVALILMDNAHIFDTELIITCLLHDAVEDTEDLTPELIEHFFGSNVARRVLALTKNPDDAKGAYLARLHDADPYTVICKMCDRLDNMRHLKDTSESFQKRKALETKDHYVYLFDTTLYKLPRHESEVIRRDVFAELNKLVDQYVYGE